MLHPSHKKEENQIIPHIGSKSEIQRSTADCKSVPSLYWEIGEFPGELVTPYDPARPPLRTCPGETGTCATRRRGSWMSSTALLVREEKSKTGSDQTLFQ